MTKEKEFAMQRHLLKCHLYRITDSQPLAIISPLRPTGPTFVDKQCLAKRRIVKSNDASISKTV